MNHKRVELQFCLRLNAATVANTTLYTFVETSAYFILSHRHRQRNDQKSNVRVHRRRPFKDLEKLDEKVHTGKVRATVRRLSPTRANHACNERARARTSCGLYGCRGAGPDGDNDVNSAKEITRRNLGRPFGRLQYRNGETV